MNPYKNNWHIKILFLLLFACGVSTAFALSSDSNQKLLIAADSTEVNYKQGLSKYSGHVKLDQGTTHVTADYMEARGSKHKLRSVIAYGSHERPVSYKTLTKFGGVQLIARAHQMTYYPLKSLVLLQGDAVVTQGDHKFSGPVIKYDINNRIVTTPASDKGRTSIFIKSS